ncbi:hypothetical protein ACHHYP_20516 [Achlya hypogyna]|uniref:Tc1-like transposase DDE domain-containing protein n=1 Tax=Achlya hypogyna TaxID=1202772 RepID=A0A1V9YK66_ACHHY|nr:hypothetical protein ACHHYP_20516 [Achlya hypogyna]
MKFKLGLVNVKAELLELARLHREPPRYTCTEIAKGWGHRILFTPPYHPELQPIEVIWAVGKNWNAQSPATTMRELGEKIEFAFKNHVQLRTWIGTLRKVQRVEDKYFSMLDSSEVVDETGGSESKDEDSSAVLFAADQE